MEEEERRKEAIRAERMLIGYAALWRCLTDPIFYKKVQKRHEERIKLARNRLRTKRQK